MSSYITQEFHKFFSTKESANFVIQKINKIKKLNQIMIRALVKFCNTSPQHAKFLTEKFDICAKDIKVKDWQEGNLYYFYNKYNKYNR